MNLIGPIPSGDKWGYLHPSGEVAIPFVYDGLGEFHEGLAWFLEQGSIGFIDTENQVAIAPQFETGERLGVVSDFSSGLAPVRLGGLEGYIDRSGQFAIPPRYESCGPFVGDIAVVVARGAGAGVIDLSGAWLGGLSFDSFTEAPYEPDLIKVFTMRGGDQVPALVDRHGRLILGPFEDLADISPFNTTHPRYAVVRDRLSDRTGFCDRRGERVIPCQFGSATGFSEGLAAASNPGHRWGFIDAFGGWKIEPAYTAAGQFHGGTAAVRSGPARTGKWTIIDARNKAISSHSYERLLQEFTHGWRLFLHERRVLVLDPNAQIIWSAPG